MRIADYRKLIILSIGAAYYTYLENPTLENHRVLMNTLGKELMVGAILHQADDIVKLPREQWDDAIGKAIKELSTTPEEDAMHGIVLTTILAEETAK